MSRRDAELRNSADAAAAAVVVRPAESAPADRARALAEHVRECADCRIEPIAVERVGAALDAAAAAAAVPGLSLRVLLAAAPALAAHAARAYRRRLARSLLLTLSPLPIVVFFNVYLLREFYSVLSMLLPGGVVAWMVVGYGAMVALLCALTYAALPLLVAQAQNEALLRSSAGVETPA